MLELNTNVQSSREKIHPLKYRHTGNYPVLLIHQYYVDAMTDDKAVVGVTVDLL